MAQPEAYEELADLRRVMVMTALSRSRVYREMSNPARPFPKPLKLGGRSVWVVSEVQAWIRATIVALPRMGSGVGSTAGGAKKAQK